MKFKKRILTATAVGAIAFGIISGTAMADAITDRQAKMKEIGGAIKALAAIAKKEAPFDAAVVNKNASLIAANLEAAKSMFPKGSEKGEKETWAKPEIWSDMAGFEAALGTAIDAAKKLAAVSDESKFLPGLKALGGGCGGCHKKFRRPKE